MPVEGYEHEHLWLWRSKFRYPWPLAPMLDPDWDEDGEWQSAVAERLARGEGLHSLSMHEMVRSYGPQVYHGGEEGAEEYAKDADRSGSPWLNDHAIAIRAPLRELRKQGWAEAIAENKIAQGQASAEQAAKRAAKAAKEAEERAAREAAHRAWEDARVEKARRRAEQDAEWERTRAEREAQRAQDAAKREVDKIVLKQLREQELREEKARREAELEAHYDQLQAEAKQRLKEREIIFKNKWQCVACKGLKISVKLEGAGYNLKCESCGAHAWGKHATIAKMARAA